MNAEINRIQGKIFQLFKREKWSRGQLTPKQMFTMALRYANPKKVFWDEIGVDSSKNDKYSALANKFNYFKNHVYLDGDLIFCLHDE